MLENSLVYPGLQELSAESCSVRKWQILRTRDPKQDKQNLKNGPIKCVLTAKEREDALKALFLAAQKNTTFPETTLCRLAAIKDENSGLLVCGDKYKAFGERPQYYQMWQGYRCCWLRKHIIRTMRRLLELS